MSNVTLKLEDLIKTAQAASRDAVRFDHHEVSAAGVRVRKQMQEIRLLAKLIRDDIQEKRRETKEKRKYRAKKSRN